LNVGVDLVSNYVDEGESVTNNQAAVQPHVEVGYGAFYGGVWLSNIVSGPDSTETDLYFGVAGDFPGSSGFSYDINYTPVYYNSTGYQGATLEAGVTYSPSSLPSIGFILKNDLAGGPFAGELGSEYSFGKGFGVSGEIGKAFEPGATKYWSVGISKEITDSLSVEVSYNDTNASTPLYALMLSWATDMNGMFEK
jgi:uncharacterized protein (TIGR02001 family)